MKNGIQPPPWGFFHYSSLLFPLLRTRLEEFNLSQALTWLYRRSAYPLSDFLFLFSSHFQPSVWLIGTKIDCDIDISVAYTPSLQIPMPTGRIDQINWLTYSNQVTYVQPLRRFFPAVHLSPFNWVMDIWVRVSVPSCISLLWSKVSGLLPRGLSRFSFPSHSVGRTEEELTGIIDIEFLFHVYLSFWVESTNLRVIGMYMDYEYALPFSPTAHLFCLPFVWTTEAIEHGGGRYRCLRDVRTPLQGSITLTSNPFDISLSFPLRISQASTVSPFGQMGRINQKNRLRYR
jgi:hypothetical protein